MSLSIKHRKTGDDLRAPLSSPQRLETKLPKVLWGDIYKFLVGDIRVSGIHGVVLAAKDIVIWGRLSYGMRTVVADLLISSLFHSFRPLVRAIASVQSDSRLAARQAIERLTKISYGDTLELPQLNVEITDPASLSIVQNRACRHPLYTLPLPDPQQIGPCMEQVMCVDQPSLTGSLMADTYMPPAFFCQTFTLLMKPSEQRFFCSSAMTARTGEAFKIAPFLGLGEGASLFLDTVILSAIFCDKPVILEEFTHTEYNTEYLLNFRYLRNPDHHLAYVAMHHKAPGVLSFLLQHKALCPLLFKTTVLSGGNIAHGAAFYHDNNTICSLLLSTPLLRPLMFATDLYGRNIFHYAATNKNRNFNTKDNMVRWLVKQDDPQLNALLTQADHDNQTVAHVAFFNERLPVLEYLASNESLKHSVLKPFLTDAGFCNSYFTNCEGTPFRSLLWLSASARSIFTNLLQATHPSSQDTIAHQIAAADSTPCLRWFFGKKETHPLFVAKNRFGQTAFDIAFQKQNPGILDLLHELVQAEPEESPIRQSYAAAKRLYETTRKGATGRGDGAQ